MRRIIAALPVYQQYWGAILANPENVLPFTTTADTVAWENTRIVRDVEVIRRMKQQPGKDMHAVGGDEPALD